jgi:hypothetical protein
VVSGERQTGGRKLVDSEIQLRNRTRIAGSQAARSACCASGVAPASASFARSTLSDGHTSLRSSALRSIAVTVINSRAISRRPASKRRSNQGASDAISVASRHPASALRCRRDQCDALCSCREFLNGSAERIEPPGEQDNLIGFECCAAVVAKL